MSTPPSFPPPDDGEQVEDQIPPQYRQPANPVDSMRAMAEAMHPASPGHVPPQYSPTQPPPGRRRRRLLIGAGVVVALAVVALIVVGALHLVKPTGATMSVGQCANLTYNRGTANVRAVSCSSQSANYRLAVRFDDSNTKCPGDYDSVYNNSNGLNYNSCFELNVAKGDCLKVSKTNSGDSNITKVACNAHPTFRIYRIVPDSADPAACGGGVTRNEVYVYRKPALHMLCRVDAGYRPDDATMPVGACAQIVVDASGSDTVTQLDCTDPAANYKLAVRYSDVNTKCPGADYFGTFNNNYDFNYNACFELNVKTGDCVKATSVASSEERNVAKVPCSATADYKIGEVVTGQADPNACGAGTDPGSAYIYPKPDPVTLCLVSPT